VEDLACLNFVGASRPFVEGVELIRKYARSSATVLIFGESGTGKELAARAIHYLSARRDLPFVPVNCGALPEQLVESELFGHTRGAFTDARETRAGLVTQAKGGTLFLDEIETMSCRAQVVLLRFLQSKEFRSVGSGTVQSADVRVIAAANTDLQVLVNRGRFRADLLFRLDVLPIRMPPLRERSGDLVPLAQSFLDALNRQSHEAPKVLSPESLAVLSAHSWPGNVRELENVIERAFVLAFGSPVVRITTIGEQAESEREASREDLFRVAKARAVAQFERTYITALLTRTAGNITLAARISGKDRRDIGKLLQKYGLKRDQFSGTFGV
jgi:DNA-binding NtrC family response regulator